VVSEISHRILKKGGETVCSLQEVGRGPAAAVSVTLEARGVSAVALRREAAARFATPKDAPDPLAAGKWLVDAWEVLSKEDQVHLRLEMRAR